MTFTEHKEQTAKDCEAIAEQMTKLAATVREGNMTAFEEYWIEGGAEEGDSKIQMHRQLIIFRYAVRSDKVGEVKP